MKKTKRYLHYINVFLKSSEKGTILKELFKEMNHKGLTMGLKSFLHLRVYYFFPGYDLDSAYEPIFSIKEKQEHLRISIPTAIALKLSIIVAMSDDIEHVYYYIRSVVENKGIKDYEIIVVDNNSKRGNELLVEHIANLKLVKNNTEESMARCYNNGAAIAKGEHLLFVSSGLYGKDDWSQRLLDIFDNFENVGIVGPKHLYSDKRLKEAGGIVRNDGTTLKYGDEDWADKARYNFVREVDFVSATFMMVVRNAWEKVGGFDEKFVSENFIDVDLCFQVRKYGYGVLYQPASVVVHIAKESVHGMENAVEEKKLTGEIRNEQPVENLSESALQDWNRFLDKWKNTLIKLPKKEEKAFRFCNMTDSGNYVLIVDHVLPIVNGTLAANDVMNILDVFVGMGSKIVFLCTHHHQVQYAGVLQQMGIEVVIGDHQEYVRDNMHHFKAVVLNGSASCMPYMILLRNNNYTGKIIYNGRELGYLKLDQESMVKRDLTFDLETKIIRAREDFMYVNADHALMSKCEEIDYLRTYISKPLHYLPNHYFDVKDKQPLAGFDNRDGILLLANGGYLPDIEAIRWMLEKVYEPLHDKKIKLTIVCADVPSFVYDYKKKYELMTIVNDSSKAFVEKMYNSAKVLVAPMRTSTIVKGRVLQAMANRVPVAGTFLAFEGLPKDDGYRYHECTSSTDLADHIYNLCTNKSLWNDLSDYGADYVNANFNKDAIKNIFAEILN